MFFSTKEAIPSKFEELNPLIRFYEREWVDETIRILEEEEDGSARVPVRIFAVPRTLISDKKDAYVPQWVAIGPYHQKRLDLYQMMQYKISSAKRIQNQIKTRNIRDVVEHFCELEHCIRACYHKFIDYSGETLAWTMAIDASFLLEYLQMYSKGITLTKVPYCMSHLLDYTGRKSGHQEILRDIIMLENQIPLFVLREFLGFCTLEKPNEFFAEALKGLCKELSPIKYMDNFPTCQEELFERDHSLDLLYYTLVPSSNGEGMVIIVIEAQEEEQHGEANQSGWKKAFDSVLNKLPCIISAPTHYINQAASSKKFAALVKLPCLIIKRITKSSTGKKIDELVSSVREVAKEAEMVDSQETPLMEEIAIPSVTELTDVGIRFRPTKGGINTIKFDAVAATIHLPIINMDEKSEVVLRNLVAYESSVAPEIMGSLILRRM